MKIMKFLDVKVGLGFYHLIVSLSNGVDVEYRSVHMICSNNSICKGINWHIILKHAIRLCEVKRSEIDPFLPNTLSR